MKRILGMMLAAGLLASMASAQEVVIQPLSTALQQASRDRS